LFTACEEKELPVNPDLNQPSYPILDGPPGSLGEIAKEYFDRWGSIVIYEFTDLDIRWAWQGLVGWTNTFVRAQPGTEQEAAMLLRYLRDNLFSRFPDDFVRSILPYRIFLVDSCRSGSELTNAPYADVLRGNNKFVIANVRPRLDTLPKEWWDDFRDEAESIVMQGIYITAPRPVRFFNLRWNPANQYAEVPNLGLDPEGVITHPTNPAYNNVRYSHNVAGYIRGFWQRRTGLETLLQPLEEQDFVDFTEFLVQSPAAQIEYMLIRFPRLRARALELVPFLRNEVGLDVIEAQKLNNPDDPLMPDFYQQLQRL
jgi:hypothetical protein